MREVLTIEVGQAGIQLGNSIWEQYCAEHSIDNTGKRKEQDDKNVSFRVFLRKPAVDNLYPEIWLSIWNPM